ncbi:uncharacterized protein LOC128224468 [Mya arenaria]|uniref:uncharacterized protein LOC128224468 n=1 Tax=Mya arenaria TaxID=6604 RepID=UPI0022DED824|nr:uncharacterized protein LOC128224468 [Mya arenaria]
MMSPFKIFFATFLCFGLTYGYSTLRRQIPNGYRVRHPCGPDRGYWEAVGHMGSNYMPEKNAFGADVRKILQDRTLDWSKVCNLDSDGDGLTNGEELGDPGCKWTTANGITPFGQVKGHPGLCEPERSQCTSGKTFPECPNSNAGGGGGPRITVPPDANDHPGTQLTKGTGLFSSQPNTPTGFRGGGGSQTRGRQPSTGGFGVPGSTGFMGSRGFSSGGFGDPRRPPQGSGGGGGFIPTPLDGFGGERMPPLGGGGQGSSSSGFSGQSSVGGGHDSRFGGQSSGGGRPASNFGGPASGGGGGGGPASRFGGPTSGGGGPASHFGSPTSGGGGPARHFGGPTSGGDGHVSRFGGHTSGGGGHASRFGGPTSGGGGPASHFGGPTSGFGGESQGFNGYPGGSFEQVDPFGRPASSSTGHRHSGSDGSSGPSFTGGQGSFSPISGPGYPFGSEFGTGGSMSHRPGFTTGLGTGGSSGGHGSSGSFGVSPGSLTPELIRTGVQSRIASERERFGASGGSPSSGTGSFMGGTSRDFSSGFSSFDPTLSGESRRMPGFGGRPSFPPMMGPRPYFF